jgi:hypothetical protein
MKRKIKTCICVGLVSLLMCTGCTANWDREMKDIQSNWSGGLDRIVTVYDSAGNVIKTYEGEIDIEDNEYGNKIKFDLDGKRHIIYNAIVIVDEK